MIVDIGKDWHLDLSWEYGSVGVDVGASYSLDDAVKVSSAVQS